MQAPNAKSLATEDMLLVKDIAKYFKVHPSTIYRAIQAKQLFAHRIGGKKRGPLRVPRSAFEAYCKSEQSEAVAA